MPKSSQETCTTCGRAIQEIIRENNSWKTTTKTCPECGLPFTPLNPDNTVPAYQAF